MFYSSAQAQKLFLVFRRRPLWATNLNTTLLLRPVRDSTPLVKPDLSHCLGSRGPRSFFHRPFRRPPYPAMAPVTIVFGSGAAAEACLHWPSNTVPGRYGLRLDAPARKLGRNLPFTPTSLGNAVAAVAQRLSSEWTGGDGTGTPGATARSRDDESRPHSTAGPTSLS